MIRAFGGFIVVALIMTLLTPVVFFGYAAIFVSELISRIIYAESALDEIDVKAINEAFFKMLNEMKLYIIG